MPHTFVLLCAQASVPAQLLSQFSVFTLQDFVPVSVPAQFWELFFCAAQVLHQVYGGGILAVIMHHRHQDEICVIKTTKVTDPEVQLT